MADYKETALAGSSFSRCRLIEISNPYQQTPVVIFTEERITNLADRALRDQPDAPIRASYDPTAIVAIFDPVTLRPTTQTITMQEIYGILFSAYLHFATRRDIAALKLVKTMEIDAALSAANNGVFVFAGKQFSCDSQARLSIEGVNEYVNLNSSLPSDWSGAWQAIDFTSVVIPDVAAWAELYAAMVANDQANFAHSQALKDALAAAESPEAVAAINW